MSYSPDTICSERRIQGAARGRYAQGRWHWVSEIRPKRLGFEMRPRILTSIIIFISSYSPLGLILVIKDDDVPRVALRHPVTDTIILAVSALSVVILLVAMSQIKDGFPVLIKRVVNRSNELVNYTIPYMISFFGFDVGKWQDMLSFGIFMGLMGLLTIRTQSLFINPILASVGYGLYDAEFQEGVDRREGILLSRLELRIDREYKIRRVSYFLYLVTGTTKEVRADGKG